MDWPSPIIRTFYQPGEWNEVIWITYKLIMSTLKMGCDSLTITSTQLIDFKDGQVVSTFDIAPLLFRRMTFREALEFILERDQLASHYLHIISSTPDELTCSITYPEQ